MNIDRARRLGVAALVAGVLIALAVLIARRSRGDRVDDLDFDDRETVPSRVDRPVRMAVGSTAPDLAAVGTNEFPPPAQVGPIGEWRRRD